MKVNKVNKENYCNNNKAYFCGPSARSSACDVVVFAGNRCTQVYYAIPVKGSKCTNGRK